MCSFELHPHYSQGSLAQLNNFKIMSSYDSLSVRQLLSRGTVVSQVADSPIALRMRYVGTGTLTSITITTATNLVVVSTDGGTDTYAFATYTTIGALADAINGDGIIECKVIDALRSDLTASSYFLENTALTVTSDSNGVACYDAHVDTSVYKAVTSCITNMRDFNTANLSKSHRVHLQSIQYFATLGGAGANLLRVYLRRGKTETQIYGTTSVSATNTTVTFASGVGKITGNNGDEIIVRLQDGTSLADAALAFAAVGILE